MVVSPLKRLQLLQVREFERYGIHTVAINEDTPSDLELWQVSSGTALRHLHCCDMLNQTLAHLGGYFLSYDSATGASVHAQWTHVAPRSNDC